MSPNSYPVPPTLTQSHHHVPQLLPSHQLLTPPTRTQFPKSSLPFNANPSSSPGLPGRPEVTYCDGSGRDAVLVKWSAPSVTNGIVRGYKVYYRDNNSFDNQSALVLADTGIKQDGFHSKNVTGLAENTEYYFAVSGYTDAGEGEKTEWTLAKTRQKSVPNIMEAPTVVIMSWHSIHVTWKLTDDGLTGIDTFTIFLNSQV